MVKMFIDGGVFMWPILGMNILGFVFVIERFWSLSRASINTRKFMLNLKKALSDGGVEKALDLCSRTRGPIASIFHAGLQRFDKGIEAVEKSIVAAGSVEMAYLEKNLVWLSMSVALAPMLGFIGTVSGMIHAFDAIAAANDISPSIVASGIAEALITTLYGLTVAIPVQLCYNYFTSRIDKLVVDMEEASTDLVDSLADINKK
jgi:biopolymer transport protein ExbB